MTLDRPLRFERIFLTKVWGGRALATTPGIELPADLPADEPIGETWELVDRIDENSVVAGGPHAGHSLRELMEQHGEELLGAAPATPEGRFPLLVKYIDASDVLSVQVHPDDASAQRLGGGLEGKSEAWYVLATEPGAALYAGLKPGVDRAAFEATAGGQGIVECLERWEVSAGDAISIPGGTVHAIGAGVTLLEVQQNSDSTLRVYDWGRVGLDGKPRETHFEAAADVAAFGAPAPKPFRGDLGPWRGPSLRAELLRSPYFAMDRLAIRGTTPLDPGSGDGPPARFQIYVVLKGAGALTLSGSPERFELSAGDTWLVPAAVRGLGVEPEGDALELAQLYVPDNSKS